MAARTLVVEGPAGAVAEFAAELRVGDYSPRVFDGRLTCRLPGSVEADAWRDAALRRALTTCRLTSRARSRPRPPARLLEVALALAGRGYRVVALHGIVDGGCTCRRDQKCHRAGKHPRKSGWSRDATTDPAAIRSWWSRWPTANVGITLDGLVVYDVDGPTGEESLAPWLEVHPLPVGCPEVRTRRGRHLYLRLPTGRVPLPIGKGVDVLHGPRHLVVAPGSVCVDGSLYSGELPDTDRLPMLAERSTRPAEVVENQDRDATWTGDGAGMLHRAEAVVAAAPAGTRNATVNCRAYTMGGLWAAGRGPDLATVRAGLISAAIRCRLVQADGMHSVLKTIDSGWRAGVLRPLSPPVTTGDPADMGVLTRVRVAMESRVWHGAGGADEYRVLGDMLRLGEWLGATTVRRSERQSAEGTGIPQPRVHRITRRLMAGGWLDRTEVGEGYRGSTYRLRLPGDISASVGPRGGMGTGTDAHSTQTPRVVPGAHDAWTGLPAQAPLGMAHLVGGPVRTVTMAEHLGVGPRQTRRILHTLVQVGLVTSDQGLWHLSDLAGDDMETALSRAAKTRGTTGAMARMCARHREERTVYRSWWDGRERALARCRRTRPTWSRPRSESAPETVPTTPVGSRGPP